MVGSSVKTDLADDRFSWWIRLRDNHCVRCYSPVSVNSKGLPNNHTNSHYFGRSAEPTRFDPLNCDTLCYGCHTYWEERNKPDYTRFKQEQLGEKYDSLVLRGNATLRQLGMRKDRKLEAIYWKQRILEDYGIKC